ncbi:MAG: hypothetical protein HQK88_07975 [Nitrospirae bacterium]|nr:hypothetical protein [Nitrospirota bacterium]MBF0533610.1 hypothetical protein [Nitrospirota bacterium]MBF0616739.1 hypothetical protein [Nitrospirota bacterium]
MVIKHCSLCDRPTGFKRSFGIATLIACGSTLGLWLFIMPFYPKRCTICGSDRTIKKQRQVTPYISDIPNDDNISQDLKIILSPSKKIKNKLLLIGAGVLILPIIIASFVGFNEQQKSEKQSQSFSPAKQWNDYTDKDRIDLRNTLYKPNNQEVKDKETENNLPVGYKSLVGNIRIGTELYLKVDNSYLGKIEDIEPNHQFSGGIKEDAIFIKATNGGKVWVPRTTAIAVYLTK